MQWGEDVCPGLSLTNSRAQPGSAPQTRASGHAVVHLPDELSSMA